MITGGRETPRTEDAMVDRNELPPHPPGVQVRILPPGPRPTRERGPVVEGRRPPAPGADEQALRGR